MIASKKEQNDKIVLTTHCSDRIYILVSGETSDLLTAATPG